MDAISQTRKRRIIVVTNIPTPYRNYLFSLLSNHLLRNDAVLEVWFEAATERGRHWSFESGSLTFLHRFLRGFTAKTGRLELHICPEVLWKLRMGRPDAVVFGDSWTSPTVLLGTFVIPRERSVFWSESHLAAGFRPNIRSRVRGFVLRRFGQFAVPGRLAVEYIRAHVSSGPMLCLPNIVDPIVYGDRVDELRRQRNRLREELGCANDRVIVLTPARLIRKKGVEWYLQTVLRHGGELRSKVLLVVAGDGPDSEIVQRLAAESGDMVKWLGHVSEMEMLRLYALADIFLLPSLNDANPLSVLEALWARLPVIVSSGVGNWPETVTEENGWVFEVGNQQALMGAFRHAVTTCRADLEARGFASRKIAEARFDPAVVVRRFGDALLSAVASGDGR